MFVETIKNDYSVNLKGCETMAKDKEFEWRMQGMVYACRMAQEKGIEYLVNDIKRRGVTKIDLYCTQEKIDELWNGISENIYNNILITALYVLHNQFGFGKDRLKKFRDCYEKATDDVIDLDYMGEHYVTLEDYAVELNEKYKLGLNVELAAACMDVYDKKNPEYKTDKHVNGIINALRLAGYEDAARYLESKKDKEAS